MLWLLNSLITLPINLPFEFAIGTLVAHDDFGEGKVLGINGKKLQVKFKKFEEIMSIFSDFVKKQ